MLSLGERESSCVPSSLSSSVPEDSEALAGILMSSGLGVAAGKRQIVPLPLPAPGTEPGLDPPDPEALTSQDFRALAFFGF